MNEKCLEIKKSCNEIRNKKYFFKRDLPGCRRQSELLVAPHFGCCSLALFYAPPLLLEAEELSTERRSLRSEAPRNEETFCRTPTSLDISADAGSLLDSSSNGCKTSLKPRYHSGRPCKEDVSDIRGHFLASRRRVCLRCRGVLRCRVVLSQFRSNKSKEQQPKCGATSNSD